MGIGHHGPTGDQMERVVWCRKNGQWVKQLSQTYSRPQTGSRRRAEVGGHPGRRQQLEKGGEVLSAYVFAREAAVAVMSIHALGCGPNWWWRL